MNLNLLRDPWLPVVMHDGSRRTIAPWQIVDPDIAALDWPRMDFNIACLELLIGLILLADPPEDDEAWRARRVPDPNRLRERLARFEPAFNLLGDGPRFLQDLEPLQGQSSSPDMLFIDSAGESTEKNNADLMVWRNRYPSLPLPLAAMALYTFQAFAPSGGAGNRTSMRGGGPQVTLVDPGQGLWALIWANVPNGQACEPLEQLPWMRATVVSSGDKRVWPQERHPAEAFFGMPRRLRLVVGDGQVTGVVQRPHGNNYAGWVHPLSPYYRMKVGSELLPRHPPAGLFGYRHWLGIVASDPRQENDGLRQRAEVVKAWFERSNNQPAQVIVAGWAMSNMKPLDFSFSTAPLIQLSVQAEYLLAGLVLAADQFALALRQALQPVLADSAAREALREHFFALTQAPFERHLVDLQTEADSVHIAHQWRDETRSVALRLFDAQALPGLAERTPEAQREIIKARQMLLANFAGYGKYGKAAYAELNLPLPSKAKKKEVAPA